MFTYKDKLFYISIKIFNHISKLDKLKIWNHIRINTLNNLLSKLSLGGGYISKNLLIIR